MQDTRSSSKQPLRTSCDEVVLFPSIARRDPKERGWQAVFRGCVLRPRPDGLRRRLLLQFWRRALRISTEQAQTEIFGERIGDFLNLTRPRATIEIHIGQRTWAIPRRSRINGQFHAQVRVGDHDLAAGNANHHRPIWLTYRASVAGANRPPAVGQVCLVPATGWSIISDIDDTIKDSDVGDRRQLIANTFLSPFCAIAGMAEAYRTWETVGISFHYVSSSPWQLYRPLSRFLHEEGFPKGSIHLRTLQFRDPSFLQLVVGKKGSKIRAMRSLVRWYPGRRFILVGDAGEKDPELYGALARRFPRQVARLFIRELPGQPVSLPRLRRAFADIPEQHWHVFRDSRELAGLVADEFLSKSRHCDNPTDD